MSKSLPTILVVDNDEGLVAAVVARLEHCGYQCVTAGTGAQALAMFREQTIDLVITDVSMPGGDGIVLAKTLCKAGNVPIIVITGFRGEYRRQLQALPNTSVLEKPFDVDELLDLVEAGLATPARRQAPSQARHRH